MALVAKKAAPHLLAEWLWTCLHIHPCLIVRHYSGAWQYKGDQDNVTVPKEILKIHTSNKHPGWFQLVTVPGTQKRGWRDSGSVAREGLCWQPGPMDSSWDLAQTTSFELFGVSDLLQPMTFPGFCDRMAVSPICWSPVSLTAPFSLLCRNIFIWLTLRGACEAANHLSWQPEELTPNTRCWVEQGWLLPGGGWCLLRIGAPVQLAS